MKNLYYKICLLILGTALFSCEKVINIDTSDGSGNLVIEGEITNRTGTCRVLVSTTKVFSANNDFKGVSGAEVKITEVGGNTRVLTELIPGVYEASTFAGVPGRAYRLQVVHNGQTYTAESKMPAVTRMESAFLISDEFFGNKQNLVQVTYKDPEGTDNYYRFTQTINEVPVKNIFIRSDAYSDGKDVQFTLRYFAEDDEKLKIKSGDSLTIAMMCIDRAVHKFWFSLDQSSTGQNQSASPANPVSNITGGALGYFSAHTLEVKRFRAP